MSYTPKGVFGALPRTTRGMPIVINGDPKGKNFLYAHGNSIYIRSIENPADSDIYTEHAQPTLCAKYSPSGFYIASADSSGKVRVWDTVNKEHILKIEVQPFAGPIKDLDWAPDNTKIIAGGEGRETYAHVFNMETGTSVGELIGHSKAVNSVAFKPTRPFKIVTGSEDTSAVFYQGPPFKFEKSLTLHKNFVNVVRYLPNGEKFLTASADGRVLIYDGKTGEQTSELGSPAHKGGVYGIAFNSTSTEVLTVSGDKTAKIWELASGSLLVNFTLGTTVDDMQVGCLWQGNHLLTVSLSGHINYLDRNAPSTPKRIVKGHSKPITSIVVGSDGYLYTSASNGLICFWDAATGVCDTVKGSQHPNQVEALAASDGFIVSCGAGDIVKFVDVSQHKFSDASVKLSSEPHGVAVTGNGTVVAACVTELVVLSQQKVVSVEKISYEATSVSARNDGVTIAVGGLKDHSVHVYELEGHVLSHKTALKQSGQIVDVRFSPDGAYLASCDSNRKVAVYSLPDFKSVITEEWCAHNAKVNCLAWAPDSRHLASGGLDQAIYIWDVENKGSKVPILRAHPQSSVTGLAWLSDNLLVSVGHDSTVRKWEIKY